MQCSIIATRETIFKRSELDRLSPWPTINRRRIFFFPSSSPKKFPMNNGSVVPSLVPKVFRFSDIDAYRNSIRTLNVDFTPLVRKISAEQIILNLPGCDVNCTKAFPRIYDAELYPNATAV